MFNTTDSIIMVHVHWSRCKTQVQPRAYRLLSPWYNTTHTHTHTHWALPWTMTTCILMSYSCPPIHGVRHRQGSPWESSGNRLGQTHSHSPCTCPTSEHAQWATPVGQCIYISCDSNNYTSTCTIMYMYNYTLPHTYSVCINMVMWPVMWLTFLLRTMWFPFQYFNKL